MPVHVRVDLPDRPGVLARLADGFARCGADVLSVSVSERSVGRAVDDFLLEWSPRRSGDDLTAAVESVAGCHVLGVRRVATVPDENPALDLVTHVLWQPHRAVETLVDMLPSFAGADWAAAVSPADETRCLYGTATAPAVLPTRSLGSRARAAMFHSDGAVGLALPVPDGDLLLVVAREAPSFSRSETDELVRLTEIMATLVRALLPQSSTPPSRLTARLLTAAAQV